MICWKPFPATPRIAVSGTRTSAKLRSAVSDACIPSLTSFRSRVTPGASSGTRNRVKPSWPAAGSVRVRRTITSARWPLVM
jgi:hypothetical protein